MVDSKQHYAESSWPASPSSFPFACKCKSCEASCRLRVECRRVRRDQQEFLSAQLLVCVAIVVVVLVAFFGGFLCGFVVSIRCSTWNSEVDLKIHQTNKEVQRLKETLMELKRSQDYQTNNLELSRMKRDDQDASRVDEPFGDREQNDEIRPKTHRNPSSNRNRGKNRRKKCRCCKNKPAFHITMPGRTRLKDEPTLAEQEDGILGEQNYIYGSWNVTANSSREFDLERGKSIRVNSQGLYFVYSQILFHSAAAINAYRIYADKEELARCITSVDQVQEKPTHVMGNERYKTCYTGAIVFLKTGQLIQLRSDDNYMISRQNNSNFFGLFRISM